MNNKQYKVDLHTHSIISPDGGIRAEQYEKLLEQGVLDCIAITDHNETRFARVLQEKFEEKIIVGEEITTTDGEMIGLFLEKVIPSGLTAKQTAAAIHEQGGLVLIPHPFEIFRKGIQRSVLEKIAEEIDIMEVFNGRGRFRGKSTEAESFANEFHLTKAASSDAHGYKGIGKTFSVVNKIPDRNSLKQLLQEGTVEKGYAPLWTFLYPSMNKIKNKFILGV